MAAKGVNSGGFTCIKTRNTDSHASHFPEIGKRNISSTLAVGFRVPQMTVRAETHVHPPMHTPCRLSSSVPSHTPSAERALIASQTARYFGGLRSRSTAPPTDQSQRQIRATLIGSMLTNA